MAHSCVILAAEKKILGRKKMGQNIFVKCSEQAFQSVLNLGSHKRLTMKMICTTRATLIETCSSAPARCAEQLVAETEAWCLLRCTVRHRNLGHFTYSVIRNSLHIHELGGGVGSWSAGLMPREQPGFSVLLKVTATTDMYAHWQSNHWAPLLHKLLDGIIKEHHLNN